MSQIHVGWSTKSPFNANYGADTQIKERKGYQQEEEVQEMEREETLERDDVSYVDRQYRHTA